MKSFSQLAWKNDCYQMVMELYQVGGSVRDVMLDPNAKPKDIDYAVVYLILRP